MTERDASKVNVPLWSGMNQEQRREALPLSDEGVAISKAIRQCVVERGR